MFNTFDDIYYKGFIEYLVTQIEVTKSFASTLYYQLDSSNLEKILELDLEDSISKEKRTLLKDSAVEYPITLTAFLLGLDFSFNQIDAILKCYGKNKEIPKIIEENPYRLLDLEGFSFLKIDKIALEIFNVSKDNPLRLKAYILFTLNNLCFKNGHTYIHIDDFLREVSKELPYSDIKHYLNLIISEKKIIVEDTKLYSKLFHTAELESAAILSELIRNQGPLKQLENEDALGFIKKYEEMQTQNIEHGVWKDLKWDKPKFEFSEEQKEAIKYFFTKSLFVLTGLPGTGKTTLLKTIVDICNNKKLTIKLLAPTGISAKKMAEVCKHKAATLHLSLGFDGLYWHTQTLIADVYIIDEFSMVDQILFYKFLQSLPKEKRYSIILVGDAAQLASVGPGNVLKELLNCKKIPNVQLTQIFRQNAVSDIVINAHKINQGDTSLIREKKDFLFMEIPSHDEGLELLKNIVLRLREKNYQILSPTYKGTLGVDNINKSIQEILNPKIDDVYFKCNGYEIRHNDVIMFTKNDYKNTVYNGERGIVKEIDTKKRRVSIFTPEKTINYSYRDSYQNITLDYSRVIHKCINVNTFIPTKNGLLNFSEIMEEYSVNNSNKNFIKKDFKIKLQGMFGEKETSEIFRQNNVNSFKIKTIRGYRLEGTGNHPVNTVDINGNFLWKNIENLNKGDSILIKKGFDVTPLSDYPLKIPKISKSSKRRKLAIKIKTINKDVAWLLGVIVGDGYYNDRKDNSIQITVFSKKLVNQLIAVVKNNFGWEGKIYKYPSKSCYAIHLTNKTLREIFKNLGLEYVTAYSKKIPISIRKSTPKIMAAFLSGLFDADGGVNKCGIHYTTVSYELALGVSNMLLYFGIASSFKNMKNKAYRIYIQGMDSREFYKVIGFREESRLENWKKFKHDTSGFPMPSCNRSSIPNGAFLVKNLRNKLKLLYTKTNKDSYLKKLPNYKKIVKIFSNTINGRYALYTYQIDFIEKYIIDTSLPEWKEISKFKGFYIDKLDTIESSQCDVFDFYIPEGHDFISNGFISHNSQGCEYDFVILPLINEFTIQLQRNLLYTAITRARKKVFILGHVKALNRAILNNRDISKRNTDFLNKLNLNLWGNLYAFLSNK